MSNLKEHSPLLARLDVASAARLTRNQITC